MSTVDTSKAIRTAMFSNGEMVTKELAEKYGCTTAYASHIQKKGVSSLDGVIKLAEIFGMRCSEFLALGE